MKQLLFDLFCVGGVFALAFMAEWYILPKVLLISKKKKLFDIPDPRKEHAVATPRLAGISFIPVLLLAFLAVFAFRVWFIIDGQYKLWDISDTTTHGQYPDAFSLLRFIKELCMLVCGMIILLLLGMKDDLVGVRFKSKFVVQTLAALCFISGGIYFRDTFGMFGVHHLNLWLSIPFSIFIILLITNAINLIDGIDGLASGLSIVAVVVMGTSFFQRDYIFQSMLAFSAAGVLIPFFIYNVFKEQRKKLFMGDTGSLALGFLLGYLTISHSFMHGTVEFPTRPLLIPISVLFVPAFDVARVMITRKRQGKPLFLPDRSHIHHRIIDAGFTRRAAMLMIVSLSLITLCLNIAFGYLLRLDINIIILIDMSLAALSNIWLSKRIKKYANRR